MSESLEALSAESKALLDAVLLGEAPGLLNRRVAVHLLRMQRLGAQQAYRRLTELVQVGMTLESMPGLPGLSGRMILDWLRRSRLAGWTVHRWQQSEAERAEGLARFEQKRLDRLSAAVQRSAQRIVERPRDQLRSTELFDRFAMDARRALGRSH